MSTFKAIDFPVCYVLREVHAHTYHILERGTLTAYQGLKQHKLVAVVRVSSFNHWYQQKGGKVLRDKVNTITTITT